MCDINSLDIRKNSSIDNKYFVYHSYRSTESRYTGRWYYTKFNKDLFTYDDNQMMITYVIPEFENDMDNVIKNVEVEIYFTPEGYKKLLQIFA